MAEKGQERHFGDVLAMSGVHPIASEKQTFRDGRKVPLATLHPWFKMKEAAK
jgi:hypothetical protein